MLSRESLVLSPGTLETTLMTGYDAGSDDLLPPFSPFSQTCRLDDASPARRAQASRSLLSPPRSGDKAYGSAKMWSSPIAAGGALERRDGGEALEEEACLSHFQLSPSPRGRADSGIVHGHGRAWASPLGGEAAVDGRRGDGEDDGAGLVQRHGVGKGLESPRRPSRGRGSKPSCDGSPRSRDASRSRLNGASPAIVITPNDASRQAAQSGRRGGNEADDTRRSPLRGDPFESWDGANAEPSGGGSWRHTEGHSRRRAGSGSSRSSRKRKGEMHDSEFTPSGSTNGASWRRDLRVPSHTTPSASAFNDDTLMAAASLVSFHRPRVSDAPRLRGPLGRSALKVTLGTPVEQAGAYSISSSVQAKLSIPRTAPTPNEPSLPGANGGRVNRATAAWAAGPRGVASAERNGGGVDGCETNETTKPRKPKPRGMFDAISPTPASKDSASGTPYSVCRVGRDGRTEPSSASEQSAQKKGQPDRGEEGSQRQGDAAVAHGGEPLCRTPLKHPAKSRGAAGGSGGWSVPCATPPALAMGTPCSGSKFRGVGDSEESDYDDYDAYCAVKPTPLKRAATPPSATKRLFSDVVAGGCAEERGQSLKI